MTPTTAQETQARDPSEALGSFSIIPSIYESELDSKYGIVLANLKNGNKSGFKGNLEKNVSFRGGYKQSSEKIRNRILRRYKSIPDFCSMIIETEEELLKHVEKIHELSYHHYVWAKENSWKFPHYCCGASSRNLFLNLMDKGYPNSTQVYNVKQDHAYTVLPLIYGKNRRKSFIVVDPTSDQMFNYQNAPRNSIFVIFGIRWQYKTDWNEGKDLYPKEEDNSTFANLHTLRKNHVDDSNISTYFNQVFRNPVRVQIDEI